MKYTFLSTAFFFLLWLPLSAEVSLALTEGINCVCSGNPQQAFTVTAEGTAGPFTYLWSGPGGYSSIEKEPSDIELGGTYTLAITNAYQCTFEYEIEVPSCEGPDFDFNITPPSSCGAADGQLTLSVTGDEAPYSIQWYANGDASSTGSVLSNIPFGNYYAEVTDDRGCIFTTAMQEVTDDGGMEVTATIWPSCSNTGEGVGAVRAIVDGGTSPYTYNWSTGSTNVVISYLQAGTYTVTVTDAAGCTIVGSYEVEAFPAVSVSLDYVNDATCPEEEDGSINVTANNGTSPYEFFWTVVTAGPSYTGIPGSGTDNLLENIGAGTYHVEVRDANGCYTNYLIPEEVEEPDAIELNANVFPTCPSGSTGSIDLNVTGSTPPYTYLWNNGVQTEDLSGLSVGVYVVNIYDANGCIHAESIEIFEDPAQALVINLDEIQPCPGSNFGQLIVSSVDGGDAPYTYAWSNGSTGAVNANLLEDTYCLSVTDANGCVGETCYDLVNEFGCDDVDCSPLVENIIITKHPCFGQDNGSMIVNLNPGVQVHSYQWSNGGTAPTIKDIPEGNYCVTVTDLNACTEVFCQYLNEQTIPIPVSFGTTAPSGPTAMDGAINVSVAGGVPPYSFEWTGPDGFTSNSQYINNLTPGEYCLRVSTRYCYETIECITLDYECPPLIIGIAHHGFIQCEGETGMMTVNLFDLGTSPYSILWSNGATTATIDGLDPGYYSVTVTDAVGCIETSGLNMQLVNEPLEISEADISNGCAITGGSITLDVEGGVLPYTYQWSDGQSTQSADGFDLGEHCVTVTDDAGCTVEDCYTVSPSDLEVTNAAIKDNNCGTACAGSIDLSVTLSNPVTYVWSNGATTQDVYGLCAGEYTVTLSSADCTLSYTYTVGGPPSTFVYGEDYEVNVTTYFNAEQSVFGNAIVNISSDIFEAWGTVEIFQFNPELVTSPPITEEDYVLPTDNGPNTATVSISNDYSHLSIYYFQYTAPNGCIYVGYFGEIPSCGSNDSFSFNYTYDGNWEESSCGVGQTNSYQINVSSMGTYYPYYLKITMEEALNGQEAQYEEIVEINAPTSSFMVNGIPDGIVKFKSYNNCDNHFFSITHTNCCFGLSCDNGLLLNETYDESGGDRFYDFPYFRMGVMEECFDGDCQGSNNACSDIVINPHSIAPQNNCWTGTVTVIYPDVNGQPTGNSLTAVFEVVADYPSADDIVWISGDDNWNPPTPGTYFVGLSYEGNGDSDGQDCYEEIEVNFYGDGNYNEIIGFEYSNPWLSYSSSIPQEFKDSYLGAWVCETCEPEAGGTYIYNQDDCEDFGDYQWTYFNYIPVDYGNPCDGGGTITILKFDDNGNPVIMDEIPVPGNIAVGQEDGRRAFWGPAHEDEDEWCYSSGWCLFDPEYIYGFTFLDDRPILATWFDPETCEAVASDDPENPDPDFEPCVNAETDCPPDWLCVDGNCYEPCETPGNNCPPGWTCIYGACIPDSGSDNNNCVPECPDGYECIEGACLLIDICNFEDNVAGGQGANTYEFYHELSIGQVLIVEYKTFGYPDEIELSGSVDGHIECEATDGGWETDCFPIINDNNVITITVTPCPANETSVYRFRLDCASECPPELNDTPPSIFTEGYSKEHTKGIAIYPNPFTSNIDITTSNIEEPFNGQVILLDNLGREVINENVSFEIGYNSFNIEDLESLAKGIYFVMIRRDGEVYTSKKVVKVE